MGNLRQLHGELLKGGLESERGKAEKNMKEGYRLGTAPHTVTVHTRAATQVRIHLYYEYYPTYSEGAAPKISA